MREKTIFQLLRQLLEKVQAKDDLRRGTKLGISRKFISLKGPLISFHSELNNKKKAHHHRGVFQKP